MLTYPHIACWTIFCAEFLLSPTPNVWSYPSLNAFCSCFPGPTYSAPNLLPTWLLSLRLLLYRFCLRNFAYRVFFNCMECWHAFWMFMGHDEYPRPIPLPIDHPRFSSSSVATVAAASFMLYGVRPAHTCQPTKLTLPDGPNAAPVI